MRKKYDFSNARSNPHAKRLKGRSVEIKAERRAEFVAAATRWGDRMSERSVAQANKAHDVAMAIKDAIVANDRLWRGYFRSLLAHKHGGVVLLAAAVIADVERSAVIKALKRVSRSRDTMLSCSAALALKYRYDVRAG